jgi:glucosamine-6-phosphate deaminase
VKRVGSSRPIPARELNLAGASVLVYPDTASAHRSAADRIARAIQSAQAQRGKAVLGLATGNTPVPVYERLVAMTRAGELSFAGVVTYNLDEYYPMSGFDKNSYRYYMRQNLFDQVGIAPNQAHVFDGTVPEAFALEHAAEFDRWIKADGGLDLQLLGIGRNGHIGFNEPMDLPVDEAIQLGSRVVSLHPTTRQDAVADFGSLSAVPQRALTLGVAPILAARSIVILAFGSKKAEIVAKSLKDPIIAQIPATLLRRSQSHVTWILDEAAAAELG